MFLSLILPLIVCFLPMIIFFFCLWLGAKISPLRLLVTCLLGLVAIFPTSLIQFGVSYISQLNDFLRNYVYIPEINYHSLVYLFATSIFVYGLIEEVNKCFFMIFLPKRDLDNLRLLFLGMMFGLTLGCFESCIYYLDHLQLANSRGAEILYSQIFVRIFTADIIHLTCAGIGCLFVAKIQNRFRFSYIITIVVIHGLYDFFAGFTNKLYWFIIPILLLSCLECRIKYKNLCDSEEKQD